MYYDKLMKFINGGGLSEISTKERCFLLFFFFLSI